MPSLNDIELEILNALTALDTADLDEDSRAEVEAALVPYLEELAVQEKRKVDAIAFIDRKAQSEIDFLKAEEERLRSRRRVMEARRERFRSHLRDVMLRYGLKRIEGRESCLWLRRSSRVEIGCNPQGLPGEYVEIRVDYVPRKEAIRDALQRGEDVPGATLTENENVVIR